MSGALVRFLVGASDRHTWDLETDLEQDVGIGGHVRHPGFV